jgi:ABC-2 type transport system permease protein
VLRFYFEAARAIFRRQLMYRWANIAGLLTNTFFCIIFSSVVIALYHARPVVADYHVRDTLRYTWLVQSLIMVVSPFSWIELMQSIRTGDVVTDLSKPCDFCWYWFSREWGHSLYYLLYRGIPVYVAGMLLFGIGLPTSFSSWLAFVAFLPVSISLGIVFRFLYNVVAFWIIEARAMVSFSVNTALFLTGSFMPVPFFPAWLRNLIPWLPFNGFMNLPVEMLLSGTPGGVLWLQGGIQVIWLIVLVCIARMLTAAATRRVVVQGG